MTSKDRVLNAFSDFGIDDMPAIGSDSAEPVRTDGLVESAFADPERFQAAVVDRRALYPPVVVNHLASARSVSLVSWCPGTDVQREISRTGA